MEEIKITGEFIKLASLLKLAGLVMSGGEAGELIRDGEVTVDGEVCTMRGRKIKPGMTVCLAGKAVRVSSQ